MAYEDLIERDDLAGLIPPEYVGGIIQGMTHGSVAMATFRRVTIPRAQSFVPVLSVLPTAYWVGASDTGLKQTTKQAWENVELVARELAVIVPIPQAVIDDSTINLWAEIQPKLAEAFGAKVDAAALFGTDSPSGWPDSIVEEAVAAGNIATVGGSSGDITVDISNTWALVEDDGFDVSVQYSRRNMRSRLRDLRADDGQPIFQGALQRGDYPSIYGEDLLYVSNGAWDNTYALVVGDRNAALLGIRQDMQYKLFTEGVITDDEGAVVLNLMQQDAVALRATMRVGFATANPPTRSGPEDEDDRFPFAVLAEAGS